MPLMTANGVQDMVVDMELGSSPVASQIGCAEGLPEQLGNTCTETDENSEIPARLMAGLPIRVGNRLSESRTAAESSWPLGGLSTEAEALLYPSKMKDGPRGGSFSSNTENEPLLYPSKMKDGLRGSSFSYSSGAKSPMNTENPTHLSTEAPTTSTKEREMYPSKMKDGLRGSSFSYSSGAKSPMNTGNLIHLSSEAPTTSTKEDGPRGGSFSTAAPLTSTISEMLLWPLDADTVVLVILKYYDQPQVLMTMHGLPSQILHSTDKPLLTAQRMLSAFKLDNAVILAGTITWMPNIGSTQVMLVLTSPDDQPRFSSCFFLVVAFRGATNCRRVHLFA